jgi:excisionase family DNA binding protein
MSDKLLTIEELSSYLRISEEGIEKLVEEGHVPAYKICDSFLRFRKEQIDAIYDEILNRAKAVGITSDYHPAELTKEVAHYHQDDKNTLFDSFKDFIYFNDFYIVSFIVIAILLVYIFNM